MRQLPKEPHEHMNTERVMERVRRLLAIANDPAASDNEQRIALEQAQRLMDKHAIEEWQLEKNHDDVEIIKRRIRLNANPCNRYMVELANIVPAETGAELLRMPQGRKRTRRDQRHHNLRNPRRRRQDRGHLDRHGNQPRRHVARKSARHATCESQRGLEERILSRIPGRDRPQIPGPPTRDGIGRHRQGTRHRAQRPGRPMD